MASGPFADEARTVASMKRSPCSSAADHFDERATAAIATLGWAAVRADRADAGDGWRRTGFTVFDRLDLDRHTWRFAWPDTYFVPGQLDGAAGSASSTVLQRSATPAAREAASRARETRRSGRVFSWAQPPRVGVSSGVTSGGVFVFFRPTAALVRGAPRSGDRLDVSISLLRRLGLGPEPGDFGAARWGAGAHGMGVESRHRRPGSERRMDRPAPWCRRPAR